MNRKKVTVRVFRFDPSVDAEAHYKNYEVPFSVGMSVMNALDYIYLNLDGSLAYYDHAGCALGVCGQCVGKVNGKAVLFCQAKIEGDICIEPVSSSRVLKDLVTKRKDKIAEEVEQSV